MSTHCVHTREEVWCAASLLSFPIHAHTSAIPTQVEASKTSLETLVKLLKL